MEIRTVTYTEEYKWFEAGELITPTSNRTPLEMGRVYTVIKCSAPKFAGDSSVVWVEGRIQGIETNYLNPVEIALIKEFSIKLVFPNHPEYDSRNIEATSFNPHHLCRLINDKKFKFSHDDINALDFKQRANFVNNVLIVECY